MSAEFSLVAENFELDPVVLPVVPQEVPDVWPQVEEFLRPAVVRSSGRWTIPHLLAALCLGQQTLWTVRAPMTHEMVGAFTTQVVQYPASRMVAIQFLGGTDFTEWAASALSKVEGYAAEWGCNGVETVGRVGFWPFFKEQGYERDCALYEKIL